MAVFGPIHGALFVAYVLVTLVAARTSRWRPGTTIVGLLAGTPPLATVWFEHRVHRRELLANDG